jgi:hypothetical protein
MNNITSKTTDVTNTAHRYHVHTKTSHNNTRYSLPLPRHILTHMYRLMGEMYGARCSDEIRQTESTVI